MPPLHVFGLPVSYGCNDENDGTQDLVVSGFTCIVVTVEISSYRRCRNIFYIYVIGDARTKLLRRDTNRDDCRAPFLIYISRDDRDGSRYNRRLPFLRYASRDNSRYTIVEMPS